MSKEEKKSIIDGANKVAPFFELEITLRVFGQVIFHYVFPPKKF